MATARCGAGYHRDHAVEQIACRSSRVPARAVYLGAASLAQRAALPEFTRRAAMVPSRSALTELKTFMASMTI